MKKKNVSRLGTRIENIVAQKALSVAKKSLDTVCFGPCFEPKQPKELERLGLRD